MYKVGIRITYNQEREIGDYKPSRRVKFSYETELPFVPVIGMQWEDEDKLINIPVNNLSWSGDDNKFIVKHHVSMASKEEIESFITDATAKGWEVRE